jgi:hypothetical protein
MSIGPKLADLGGPARSGNGSKCHVSHIEIRTADPWSIAGAVNGNAACSILKLVDVQASLAEGANNVL